MTNQAEIAVALEWFRDVLIHALDGWKYDPAALDNVPRIIFALKLAEKATVEVSEEMVREGSNHIPSKKIYKAMITRAIGEIDDA